jgi:hypothetical protein
LCVVEREEVVGRKRGRIKEGGGIEQNRKSDY